MPLKMVRLKLLQRVVKKLTESGGLEVLEVPGIKEQVVFSLPRELVSSKEDEIISV